MDDFIFGTLTSDESRINFLRTTRGGITHNHKRSPRDPLPDQEVGIELTIGPDHPHDQAWVYWTNDGSDPTGSQGRSTNGHATPLKLIRSEWDNFMWGYIRTYRGAIPGQAAGTIVRYRVAAGGRGEDVHADDGTFYGYYVENDPPPAWTQDMIIYQIFSDRFFSSAKNFPNVESAPSLKCNGTLRGIIEKLDYIAGTGANCLWLTPIFPSPSYHGYDATSFFEISPRLGTKEDFKELIDQAHARGMRILMDFVPNHWSNEHPNFVEATKKKDSPFVKWYTFDKWPREYKTFFGVKTLPQINLRYPDAREHVLNAAKYWLDFGVDGFRVDYCVGPTPDFFADFRKVTRSAKPDCWTFGEAVTPPDSQITFDGLMDGTLDFMLLDAFRKAFAYGQWDAKHFADFLDRHDAYFPDSFTRPSFLDNHDMNRFLWVAKGDKRKLKLAALCQYTLKGAPIFYYGTEVGLSQDRDVRQKGWAIHEEARLPMIWGEKQDHDLLRFYRELSDVRLKHDALKRGTRVNIYAEGNILAYRRSHNGENLVSVINLSDQENTFSLKIVETIPVFAIDPACEIKLDGEMIHIKLSPYGGVILK